MALHLITLSGQRVVSSFDDPEVTDTSGPAVIMTDETPTGRISAPQPDTENGPARPLAYRETAGDWMQIGYEAADHWTQLTPDLRALLLADTTAPLDIDEFRTATNGGSASIITNNWVYSGSPRIYRVAGQLREFITTFGAIVSS